VSEERKSGMSHFCEAEIEPLPYEWWTKK